MDPNGRATRHAVIIALLAIGACKGSSPPPPEESRPIPVAVAVEEEAPLPVSPRETPRVVAPLEPSVIIVTIDGVRWQEIFGGGDPSLAPGGMLDAYADPMVLAPRLHELAASGVAFGADAPGCGVVRTHGPSNISLPGYFEILGGRATSCRSNQCPRTESSTILDDAARAGLVPVASIASWEPLERAASRGNTGVLIAAGSRAWPSEPPSKELAELAERGAHVGPFPAPAGAYRPDDLTARIAIEYVRAASPRLLHVGLGDADEWAHRGNYVAYLDAIHAADAFIGDLADVLDERGKLASTTVIVTTDHGRARDFRRHGPGYPESQRAFLFAFGNGIPNPGARCASRDIELTDVGATVRALLDLAQPGEGADIGRPIAEIVAP